MTGLAVRVPTPTESRSFNPIMMNTKSSLLWVAALSLAGACGPQPEHTSADFDAPRFTLPSLKGDAVSLEDMRGQVVVIHFGASWCPFCRAEDPHLEALYQAYRDRGVAVLVVNVAEPDADAARWKTEAQFSFPMLLDRDGDVASRYAPLEAQPDLPRHEVMVASNLVIDRTGKVRFMSLLDTRTFDARLVALRARLDEVLAEG